MGRDTAHFTAPLSPQESSASQPPRAGIISGERCPLPGVLPHALLLPNSAGQRRRLSDVNSSLGSNAWEDAQWSLPLRLSGARLVLQQLRDLPDLLVTPQAARKPPNG